MKAFRFQFDSALRWRESQVDIERNRTALTTAGLKAARDGIELRRAQLASQAEVLSKGSSGEALQLWGGWTTRCTREIRDLEQQCRSAEQALQANLRELMKANQNKRVLEKLRQGYLRRWHDEAGRELEGFASEMFLRQATIRKRTGA